MRGEKRNERIPERYFHAVHSFLGSSTPVTSELFNLGT